MKKILWIFTILLVIGSVPSLFEKHRIEQSSKNVEYVVDYESLLTLSETAESEDFIHESLLALKKANVTSIGIHENTLKSLEEKGYISVFTGKDLRKQSILSNEKNDVSSNYTYVFIHESNESDYINNMLHGRFSDVISDKKVVINGKIGFEIKLPKSKSEDISLPILESEYKLLTRKPYSFKVVVRIGNNWEKQEGIILEQVKKWSKEGNVSKIVFTGGEAIGYKNNKVNDDAIRYISNIAPVGYIEYFSNLKKQKGIPYIANKTNFNIVRLHSLSEYEFSKLLEEPDSMHERIELAVKDRNIRVVYFNIHQVGPFTSEQMIAKTISTIEKASKSLSDSGFEFGVAKKFDSSQSLLIKLSRYSALFAGIFFSVLLLHFYFPKISYLIGGLSISLVVLGKLMGFETILIKMFALSSAITIPILSIVVLIELLNKEKHPSKVKSIGYFILTSFISLMGALVVTSIHSRMKYVLYIDQFRGVGLLHLIPIAAMFVILLLFFNGFQFKNALEIARKPIRIYHLGLLALAGGVALFYLSRTGNSGMLLPFEEQFRSLLENTLDVRPRTKEFLIGHPILFVAIYYWHKNKWMKWLLPVGIIGQLSIVSTFTHLHTPVVISLMRTGYGLLLGLIVAVIMVFVIEFIFKFIKK